MRVRSIAALGFLSVMAAISIVTVPGNAAADSSQSGIIEERVGHGGSLFHSKTTSTLSGNCESTAKGALVEERIGHGGSVFYNKTASNCEAMAKGALVEQRIGHGGSVYRQAIN